MAQNLVNALVDSSDSQSPQVITLEIPCEERLECKGDFQNYDLYPISVWGSCGITNFKTVQILQNKILKVLFCYDRMNHAEVLYGELGVYNLEKLRNLKKEICNGEFVNSPSAVKQEWIIIKDELGKNRLDALGNTHPILISVESVKTERTETEENEENCSSKSDTNKENSEFDMEPKEEICDDYLDIPSLIKYEELVLKDEVEQNRYPLEIGEPIMYQCAQCNYQAIRKDHLIKHYLTHAKSEEAVTYKCDQCDYLTVRKDTLIKHSLIHRKPEAAKMFQCLQCDYQSIKKYRLKSHMYIHMTTVETEVYKCNQCDYQTMRKYSLRQHTLIHKKPGEVNMYKCDQCDYQTIRKNNLQKHSIVHRIPRGAVLYKCDQCSYRTLKEGYLKKHFLIHEKPLIGNV